MIQLLDTALGFVAIMAMLSLLVKCLTSLIKSYVDYYSGNLYAEVDSLVQGMLGQGLGALAATHPWLNDINWKSLGEEYLTVDKMKVFLQQLERGEFAIWFRTPHEKSGAGRGVGGVPVVQREFGHDLENVVHRPAVADDVCEGLLREGSEIGGGCGHHGKSDEGNEQRGYWKAVAGVAREHGDVLRGCEFWRGAGVASGKSADGRRRVSLRNFWVADDGDPGECGSAVLARFAEDALESAEAAGFVKKIQR